MSFLRRLLIISIMCFAAPNVLASSSMLEEEAEQVRHGRHFATSGRKIVVETPNPELTRHLSERLAAHGAIVVDDFISKMFGPRVTVSRVAKIDGLDEAYFIEVNKSKISICYTSAEMLERAIKQFYFLFDAPYGQRIIQGIDIYYYADRPVKSKNPVKRNKAGIIDGVTSVLPSAQVETAIRAQLRSNPASDVMMAMVNRTIFRIDFAALQGINPAIGKICPNDQKYSPDQIRRFVATAREAGGEFVPAIDLLSDNEIFKTYTGHKMNSVEGMRFVRSMIEQCARQWNIKRICIGRRENSVAPKYYIDFLNDIANREGIKLIIL